MLKNVVNTINLVTQHLTVALAAAICFLPYNAFAFGRADLGEDNRAFVDDLIRELKEKAQDDRLRDELQQELEELLEELEKDLKNSESELEQAAKLEEALEKLDELFKEEVSGDMIGKALQQFGDDLKRVAYVITRSCNVRYEEVFEQMDQYVRNPRLYAVTIQPDSIGSDFWFEEFLKAICGERGEDHAG